MMSYFKYLHYGLAFILTFIGIKMVIAPFFHISSQVSLLVVAVFLIAAAGYSVIKREPESAQ
jgi:tellurite resistance protein TerC